MPLFTQRWFWEVATVTVLLLILIFQAHRIDRWRGMVSSQVMAVQLAEKDRAIQEREQALSQLRTLMVSQEIAVADAHRTIERLRASRPGLDHVVSRMRDKVVQDDVLVAEALRVLGVPIRLARQCE